eukprot:6187784-Pleurochrysis_carterae.AAC.1
MTLAYARPACLSTRLRASKRSCRLGACACLKLCVLSSPARQCRLRHITVVNDNVQKMVFEAMVQFSASKQPPLGQLHQVPRAGDNGKKLAPLAWWQFSGSCIVQSSPCSAR